MGRAVISCAMLEIFLFNSFVLALDAWVRLARVLCSVVMLSLSSFLYALVAPWYGLPPFFPNWRRTVYASEKLFLNSAQFLFSVGNAWYSKMAVGYSPVCCIAVRALSIVCFCVYAGFAATDCT